MLEIGRGNRTQPFNLRFHREPPLIPRELRFEIAERVEGSGRVLTPLSVDALGVLADSLRAHKIEALAVSFVNAYLNPEHEQIAARELRRLLPEVLITTGSELTREWHEFERTATAAANAYVGPQVSRYIAELEGTEGPPVLIGFMVVVMHWIDVGGRDVGSTSKFSTDIRGTCGHPCNSRRHIHGGNNAR